MTFRKIFMIILNKKLHIFPKMLTASEQKERN